MSDTKSLRDYLELAAQRRETHSGRRLAEIAQAGGHDISHSTVNRIRKGTYLSAPTTAVLKAIAYLAQEPEEAVLAAAAEASEWEEMESTFDAWFATRERLFMLTDRYARLRGVSPNRAAFELEDMAGQIVEFRLGQGGWYPWWDPQSPTIRQAETNWTPPDSDDPKDPRFRFRRGDGSAGENRADE